jgi:hypothetical protein
MSSRPFSESAGVCEMWTWRFEIALSSHSVRTPGIFHLVAESLRASSYALRAGLHTQPSREPDPQAETRFSES